MLDILWKTIPKEALKVFIVTACTAIATKTVEFIYENHVKKTEPAKKPKKPTKKAKKK